MALATNDKNDQQPTRLRGAGYQVDFRLGQLCLVQFDSGGQNYKASVVGVEQYSFVMVKLPTAPGVHKHMRSGGFALVRTEHGGTVYAFNAEVLAGYAKPAPILVFAYPPAVQGLKYRQHKRIRCMLPAKVESEFFNTEGLVTDMSLNGCRVMVDWSRQERVFNMMAGDRLSLSMHLDEGEVRTVHSTLMNTKIMKRHYSLGLKFDFQDTTQSLYAFIGRLEGAWAAMEDAVGAR